MKLGIHENVFTHSVLSVCLVRLLGPGMTQERQGRFKSLTLKDGSRELVGDYQILPERSHWEEMPYSLVDREATQKFEGQAAGGRRQAEEQNPIVLSTASMCLTPSRGRQWN